jgi:hypothetical protein
VGDICRKLGISEPTFYRWKRKYAGLGISEIRRLKQLEEKNRRLKQVYRGERAEISTPNQTWRWTSCRTRCRELAAGTQVVIRPGERDDLFP